MSHVFVSYSKKDKEYVFKLVDKLLAEGFDVWIDNRRLRSSEDWWLSIVSALRAADAFIVVLTPNSEDSEWAQLEITLATKYKKARFPILLEGSMDSPKWEIFARTQLVDATDGQLPTAEFYDLLANYAERKASRGSTLSDTGNLERKVNPFFDNDPILLEAVSSPPLTNEDGEDLDLTSLGIKIPPYPDPRIETVISKTVTVSSSQPAAIPKLDPKISLSLNVRRMIIAVAALLIVVLGIIAFVVTSKPGQVVADVPTASVTLTPTAVASTSTATATTSVTATLLAATSAPNLGATPVNFESLNRWLVENGHAELKESVILSELAERQRSYLMSLSVSDFNSLDSWYRDREGRNAQEMAAAMGYKGDVQMIVEVSSSVVMLDDILEKIETSADPDVYNRFHEIGINFQSSLTTDPVKVFFVLVLGTGTPS